MLVTSALLFCSLLAVQDGDPSIEGRREPLPSLPDKYAVRLERLGKSPAIDTAIEAGLSWLLRHQSPDGRWDSDGFTKQCEGIGKCAETGDPMHDVGMTGLAVLAFLGAGVTPDDSTVEQRAALDRGLKFLQKSQTEDGVIGSRRGSHFMYDHAIGTQALIEGAGLWDGSYRAAAEKAVAVIVGAQAPNGGWRYDLPSRDSDTSMTAWMVQALGTAMDFGIAVDAEVFRKALEWINSMTHPRTGRVGYMTLGGAPAREQDQVKQFPHSQSEAMTAAGHAARLWMLGSRKISPDVDRGARLLEALPPKWDTKSGRIDLYYWYWGSQLMASLGPRGSDWRKALLNEVVTQQQTLGDRRGSWNAVGAWCHTGGRVYATAILLLSLEAQHRYAEQQGTLDSVALAARPESDSSGPLRLSMSEVRAGIRYGDEEAGVFSPIPFALGAPGDPEDQKDEGARWTRFELPLVGHLEIGCLEGTTDLQVVAARLTEGRPPEWIELAPTGTLIGGTLGQRLTIQGDPTRQALCFTAFGNGHWIAIDHAATDRVAAAQLLDWVVLHTSLFDPAKIKETRAEGLKMLQQALRKESVEELKLIARELEAFAYDPGIVRELGEGLQKKDAVKVAVLEALRGYPGRPTVSLLERAFRARRSPGLFKKALLETIAQVDPETAVELALTSLTDRHAGLIQGAIAILLAHPNDPTKIRRALSKASSRLQSAARRDAETRAIWTQVKATFERAIQQLEEMD